MVMYKLPPPRGFGFYKGVRVAALRALLNQLPSDAFITPNDVGNLAVLAPGDPEQAPPIAFIDLAAGTLEFPDPQAQL